MSKDYIDKAGGLLIVTKLKNLIGKKVDAVAGKGLSTNDLTNDMVTAIGTIGSKAPTASPAFTGTPTAPTAAAGTNSTQVATTAFVTSAVATAIGGLTGISFSVVESLPATGEAGTIYLLSNGGSGTNTHDEYVYVDGNWEKLGTTEVDLSEYLKSADLVAVTEEEINAMFS